MSLAIQASQAAQGTASMLTCYARFQARALATPSQGQHCCEFTPFWGACQYVSRL